MISVTAAANSFRRASAWSLNQRPSFGSHFKAFGNGRIPVTQSHAKHQKDRIVGTMDRLPRSTSFFFLYDYIIHFFFISIKLILAFINNICHQHIHSTYRKGVDPPSNSDSKIHRVNDKCLLSIFSCLPPSDLISAKFTCQKFYNLIHSSANELSKFQVDQIKLHFDEGEFIVYPMDERRTPIRRPMQSLESLLAYLRHLSALSLFIRGLIPIETVPVLKKLTKLQLRPTQLYFLWCDFDDNAERYLKDLLKANADTVTDIGFEVCGPSDVISDDLIRSNLHRLSSLRIWNERTSDFRQIDTSSRDCEHNTVYAITDRTLIDLAEMYVNDSSCLELLDLASTECSHNGLAAIVDAWYNRPPATNLSISLRNSCGRLEIGNLVDKCAAAGIPITPHGVFHPNGLRLSLYLT